jgi:MFS family permease
MILGMTPWFSANVVSAAMAREWGASAAFQSWLTMAVQLGFVGGTLISAILMLSDRLSARRLAGVSALIAAMFTAAMAAPGITASNGIGLRLLAGAALAGVYPPGMKIAAGWWRERRGMAIGVLVGALTLGSAAPNLLRVAIPPEQWRIVLLVAGVACAVSGILFLSIVREGPYQAPSQPFDLHGLRSIARARGVRLATGGYLGHMWELYAMWSGMAGFWTYVAQQRGLSPGTGPALAFATIAMGAPGCVIAGLLADRWGRATVTIVAMALSGTCCLWVGGLIDGPVYLLVAISLLWGFTIVADSAQFSALVTELAPETYIGTALTIQTCLGFLLTMITIRLTPVWVSRFGWEYAFMPLAIGPALGILAMRKLRTPR